MLYFCSVHFVKRLLWPIPFYKVTFKDVTQESLRLVCTFNVFKKIERGSLEKCKYSEDVQSMVLCNFEEKFLLFIFWWQIPVCVNANTTDWYSVLCNICFNLWKIVNKNLCIIFAQHLFKLAFLLNTSASGAVQRSFSLGMYVMNAWVKWTGCTKENNFYKNIVSSYHIIYKYIIYNNY